MGAEEHLRRYLEQRRDAGERDLVLDELSVDDVMRLLGAGWPAPPAPAAPSSPGRDERAPVRERAPVAPPPDAPPPAAAAGWRETFRSAAAAAEHPPAAAAAPDPVNVPTGLIVGGEEHELFGGPIGQCATLGDVAALVASCQRCDLYRTARHPVPGEGNPHARLMCVGEAPGASEDETGRPFVGQAGQLLTKILGAINLSREDVFIANVLKHRPPGNRNPRPEEVEACQPFLQRQIELIRPAVIVAFGSFAAQTLLETKLAIGKLRGAVHRYRGIPVVVTYHPAALLRNPAWKRPTWQDVQLARRLLDGIRQ